MPDFSQPVLLAESVILWLLAGAWLLSLSAWRAKQAGVRYEEPPFPLYSPNYKNLTVVALLACAAAGAFFQIQRDALEILGERLMPLVLGAVDAALGLGLLSVAAWGHLALKRREASVVIEPLGGGKVAMVVLGLLGGVGLLAAAPSIGESMFNVDLLQMLSGQPGGGPAADLAMAAGLFTTGLLFWLIPEVLAKKAEITEGEPAWFRASGLVYFRWIVLGIVLLIASGMAGGAPLIEDFVTYPAPMPVAIAVPVIGAVFFWLFWAMPWKKMVRLAGEGDTAAGEALAEARFGGAISLRNYQTTAKNRQRTAVPGHEVKLCQTCLRPVSDIRDYKTWQFDHCPHCGSFIPPVLTLKDFVKHQAARIMPMIDVEGTQTGAKPKKRVRADDEIALVQDLLRALLTMAVNERGTDLHLIVEEGMLKARCRLDGVLYTMAEFDQAMARPLISTAKVMAQLDITERRRPQDGSFKFNTGQYDVDVRINTSPLADGETAALRLLYLQDVLGSLDKLGMATRNVNTLTRLLALPSGLILVTGPTGSGKSTTLYNCLQTIANGQRNIITLEDPVEYQIKGLNQMQINAAKGFTFATGLRNILRQDPDVIMVGEIRDGETGKMALDAAATGHLVFSTLHTIDAISSIGRLTDLGADAKRVAESCLLFMAQRLVRKVCPKCGETHSMSREQLTALGIPDCPQEELAVNRGAGCEACHESGYRGREGIYECFTPDDKIRELILDGAAASVLRQAARQRGMRTLIEDGLVKVMLGKTTPEEVMRVAG